MASYKLAVVIKNPSNDEEFLLVKQKPPPKFNDPEYDSYVDSDLWDLPSTQLSLLDGDSESGFFVEGQDMCLPKLDLSKFDLNSALKQVLSHLGFGMLNGVEWKFAKFVEEPDFGPGFPVHTVYLSRELGPEDYSLKDHLKWISKQGCLNWLLEVEPNSDRVGPLTMAGLLIDSVQSASGKIPPNLAFQEYPPGVKVIPMSSRTTKPFRTTNLVVFAPGNDQDDHVNDDWSSGYIPVSGAEELCIRGQRLRVVSAPGHTDGHLAVLHVSTRSLIVGDHCVGQGSALLDINSGGNMSEYFQTTYNFMELSPHSLIAMHGRVNLWPKHMLCGYLKNRRSREASILKAIEGGANTLFDIVAYAYSDVHRSLWIHAASNVRLHVDHLAKQDKLPEGFTSQKFQATCGFNFLLRWTWAYLGSLSQVKLDKPRAVKLLGGVSVCIAAIMYYTRRQKQIAKEEQTWLM